MGGSEQKAGISLLLCWNASHRPVSRLSSESASELDYRLAGPRIARSILASSRAGLKPPVRFIQDRSADAAPYLVALRADDLDTWTILGETGFGKALGKQDRVGSGLDATCPGHRVGV